MKYNLLITFTLVSLMFLCLTFCPIHSITACQIDNPFRVGPPVITLPTEIKQDETKVEKQADEGPVSDTKTIPNTAPQLPDNYVRFHMWDGTIVAGEVQVDGISVKTEFGVLEVPIARLRKLHPGLDSIPELNTRIETLVEGLGDKDFDVREKSQRELTAMGMQIREQLDRFEDGGSAERKKRLAAIKEEINEELAEFDDEDLEADRSMIRGDSVETPEFEIVGKILQETFSVKSKFGLLSVNLSDIRMAERPMNQMKDVVNKTVSVGGEMFFQRQPVSTRIRIKKGDKISIKASGVVQWVNWKSSSTPEGLGNQGQYQGIASGALCARIGNSGKVIKVGNKNQWTARQSGVLFLGVAMQDNFVKQSSYRWTGNFKAKVQVTPRDTD